jgi:hypothetical protein
MRTPSIDGGRSAACCAGNPPPSQGGVAVCRPCTDQCRPHECLPLEVPSQYTRPYSAICSQSDLNASTLTCCVLPWLLSTFGFCRPGAYSGYAPLHWIGQASTLCLSRGLTGRPQSSLAVHQSVGSSRRIGGLTPSKGPHKMSRTISQTRNFFLLEMLEREY